MTIRDYWKQDYRQLIALWEECGIYTLERGDTAEVIETCTKQGGRLLVLEDPRCGKIKGSAWLTWDGRRAYLHHLVVGPEAQGQGWGRKLVEASLDFAREKNCPIKLEVHRDNSSAVSLYKSEGFESFPGYEVFMNPNP